MSKFATLFNIIIVICILFQSANSIQFSNESSPGVGYRIGRAQDYIKMRSSQKSTLYKIIAPQLDDDRPMKLLDLHGSPYQIGYDYGYLLADQIVYSYESLFGSQITNPKVRKILEIFLDWQYHSFVRKQLPVQFLQEINGVKDGAFKSKKIQDINTLLQRVLVISNFPGSLEKDILAVLFDEFLKDIFRLKNPQIQNYIQQNILYVIRKIQTFVSQKRIMCSFFGVWGSRTLNGQLYTMRNLDWAANTGINLNKLVVIYNIDGMIPHATLGFPGLMGALTGISAKGITVHEAGQSSDLQTMKGFQWTLRMRYVMMKANNLQEAIKYWNATANTLGMNFMFGSGQDKKAVVFQTMRGYSAMFSDNDPRENRTVLTDEKGNKYVGGFSMPQVLFRTNHAYDPVIRQHSQSKLISKSSDSMIRYFILRDTFNLYQSSNTTIRQIEAINITAILGDKGTEKFYSCQNNNQGENIISVVYMPKELKMWAAFQYGTKQTFKSACCGVYVEIDLKRWFGIKQQQQ